MKFYHHQTLSKLTLAMLDTFNDIKVERRTNEGLRIDDYDVPVVFGARDKAFILSEQDSEAMERGNVNILPRMALTFESMAPNKQRQTNKYIKINKVIDGETIQFQYNPVAMDFSFTLHIATRTMLDMSMIQEQIIPFFNPSYSLFVNELEIQEEPTSIPVVMEGAEIVLPEEYEPEEIRLIEGSISFLVKGNLYPPIKDAEKIEKVKVYMGMKPGETELRSAKYEFDVDEVLNTVPTAPKDDFYDTMGQNNPEVDTIEQFSPVITNVSGNTQPNDDKSTFLKVHFKDVDSDEFTYVWSIVSGSGVIETNKERVKFTAPNLDLPETTVVRVIVIDKEGLQSLPYDVNIDIGVK